ncbi:DUF305 domain-containing protein [Nocardioides mesophilus]|uniref:DUF305 domain-containing protein n=1 Tax=Nocardioides mesophilus TaxID=433659 RepID=A0A7G9R8D3_9ACTN|nr:DUF305 domain-containing protein [Nocardioides mesophilus]QNN51858.1 DUF305 domain-containing protein [Nocardioides mesophilus]
MNRPLVAVVAAVTGLVVLVTLAAGAVMLNLTAGGGDGPGARMHGPGAMHGSGRMPGPGATSEFDYLAEMIAHHREAVAAAGELERSDRPQMRAFGRRIVADQSAQITRMEGWLARWYPGRSTDVDYHPMMRPLSDLSGDDLDRVFLEDMIGHHMAAVMASQQLLVRGTAEHRQVDALAREIRDAQRAEILRMHVWLAKWFGVDWHGSPMVAFRGGAG